MNSKVKSALRSTLQQETKSLETRLPEDAAPVKAEAVAASEQAPVAAAPAVESAPAAVVAPAAPAVPATASVAAAPVAAAKSAGKPARVAKPARAKPAPAAKVVKAPAAKIKVEDKPVAVQALEPAPAPAKKPKVVKADKSAKVEKVEKQEKVAKPVKAPKAEKPAKVDKSAKASREKVVRDSFSMPKSEHAQLKTLRETLAKAGRICTKSELLRAGVQLLLKESPASTRALVERLSVVPKGKSAK